MSTKVTPRSTRTEIVTSWQRFRKYTNDQMGHVLGVSDTQYWRYCKNGFSTISIEALHKLIAFLKMPQEDALKLLTIGSPIRLAGENK